MKKTPYYLFSLSVYLILLLQLSCTMGKKESLRLKAVKTFADNVLEKGAEHWSGQNTPLLVDGINVLTGEPVEWLFKDERFIIHNLASQQNLFRTLVGLSNLTGDGKYKDAAKAATLYHFTDLKSDCGLLRWGGHQIIDLRTLKPVGHFDANCHEFKNTFPFYELMWEVDNQATTEFLQAFWNAHVLDWSKLDMNRHGRYGLKMGELWDNEFIQTAPFFEADGLTFLNAGSDLIYAAGMLHLLSEDKGSLNWAKRLAEQYVRARHPETGLGAYQYSKPVRRIQPPEDGPLSGRLTWSSYGDRAENQFGKYFPGTAREGWVLFSGGLYAVPSLMQLELTERLGDEGKDFLKWTVEGLKAYAKYAYNPDENHFRPMWADGTDLTNYAFPRTGYYGEEGRILKPSPADELFLFTYARAYRLSEDKALWEVIRSMIKGLKLGDPGISPGGKPVLNLDTDNSDPYTVFALLEMNRATKESGYLKLAEVIGNNMIKRSFHNGFFLPDENHINANFSALEPLALLSLEAALKGKPDLVPVFSGGLGYIHGQFADMGRTRDWQAIWSKKR